MVMNYADIYASINEKIDKQDWYTKEWGSEQQEDSIRVFKKNWIGEDDFEVYYESYGQGEDPEQNPIILEINFGDELEDISEKMGDLSDRIQDELKPLIGWEIVQEEGTFARKEFPSDPLTLQPRLLEEFKKLEPIAFRIDQLLDYAPDPSNGSDAEDDQEPAESTQ